MGSWFAWFHLLLDIFRFDCNQKPRPDFGSLSNRIGEELLGEALTVVTQLMLLFDLREKYNQCD